MMQPLMPKGTAVWLINNTGLTFEQIADFCGMHLLEVQGIADGEVAVGVSEENPIITGQLTRAEITRCEEDPSASLKIIEVATPDVASGRKKAKYIPIARRQDKPDGIMWILRNYPDMTDAQIGKLMGTTKNTVESIRHKEHWNTANIRPRDPVLLGLCSQVMLNKFIEDSEKRKAHESEK